MSHQFDMVIRGGTIIDGSGGAPFEGDVCIQGAWIARIGKQLGPGIEEIDARGKIVTPGFIDIHTHYDGQVTWENTLRPSTTHGVTTVLMGNCGVGFAPIRKDQRDLAVKMMEGVEDIPEVVMTTGLPWHWETFPEYLDYLATRRADADFAAQLPHSALRVYVMGEAGANLEPPSPVHLAEMRRLTTEALKKGACGVSSSRHFMHRFRDGRPAPSVSTEETELLALADGLRDAGVGVFELAPNYEVDSDGEFALMARVQARSGRPFSFSLLQHREGWQRLLSHTEQAAAAGIPIRAQYFPRPIGILWSLDLSLHPLSLNPSYRAIADRPLADKVRTMRDPAFRARLLSEMPEDPNPAAVNFSRRKLHTAFVLGDPPNYAQKAEQSIEARARAQGREPYELLYDELLGNDGRAIVCQMNGDLTADPIVLPGRPGTLLGLGDGGAHYGLICDSCWPTYFLEHCVRDAPVSRKVPLAMAIKVMTKDGAEAMGFRDRGLISPGYRADLNIIDLDKLSLKAPRVTRDLPADGRRLQQHADGYVATLVAGQVTYRDGVATRNLPGRLVRSA